MNRRMVITLKKILRSDFNKACQHGYGVVSADGRYLMCENHRLVEVQIIPDSQAPLSAGQAAIGELLSLVKMNGFNGAYVFDSLKKCRELWRGFILKHDAVTLRDIESDRPFYDTLIVWCADEESSLKIKKVAKKVWGVDEVSLLSPKEVESYLSVCGTDKQFLIRCWWD